MSFENPQPFRFADETEISDVTQKDTEQLDQADTTSYLKDSIDRLRKRVYPETETPTPERTLESTAIIGNRLILYATQALVLIEEAKKDPNEMPQSAEILEAIEKLQASQDSLLQVVYDIAEITTTISENVRPVSHEEYRQRLQEMKDEGKIHLE